MTVSGKMTVDRALARIMELHKASPGEDVLRPELRKILSDLRSTSWGKGYDDRAEDEL